jgi:hypothetical protein
MRESARGKCQIVAARKSRVGRRQLTRTLSGVEVVAGHGEPVLSVIELACDHVLGVGVKPGIRAEDKLVQHQH